MSLRDGVRRVASGSASIGAIVVAALIPKCPLCVAAALSAIGVGATVGSSLAPIARPIGFALAAVALVASGIGEWRRRRRRACAVACGRTAAHLPSARTAHEA
jgi:hypothetical protein